ncbi:NAD(P)/FAD-dependent oxidoreductase [Brevibacillus sp. B_LB10_24]|uniref:NAD(P)/FAD-dependent oxidoreductase n=1 Tax=Brevibacillus sp. B_LB10_24 TaxID=3380645 RepID=UPI0038B7DD8B
MGKLTVENVQVLIVGAGIAGIAAAVWCKRLGLTAVCIERSDQIGGQLRQIHNEIWDFPPKIYANGAAFLQELTAFAASAGVDCRLNEALTAIDFSHKQVVTEKQSYQVEYLILATGVKQNRLSSLACSSIVLPASFSTTTHGEKLAGKRILIIGGGDRAVESAYNLSEYVEHIWIAVRGSRLRARPEWTERLSSRSNVTLLMETELLRTAENQAPRGVFLQVQGGGDPLFLPVDWVLPRIGVRGNSDEVPGLSRYGEGFLQTNAFQETSIPWIYAVGDVANGAVYASLALAAGQAMKATKHISQQIKKG